MNRRTVFFAAAPLLFVAAAPAANLTGLWSFGNGGDIGHADVGRDLIVQGAAPAWSATLADDLATSQGGVVTTVSGSANGFTAMHGIAANGGGVFVNEYSILVDVFSPASSRSSWRTIMQTSNTNGNDGDYFIRNDNDRLGTASMTYSTSGINEAKWTRLVLTFDLNTPATGTLIKAYLDGTLLYTHTGTSGELVTDGRFSLYPNTDATPIIHFFRDNDGDNGALNVGALAIWDGVLSDADVTALGGAGTMVPEPATAATAVLGLLALGVRRRR